MTIDPDRDDMPADTEAEEMEKVQEEAVEERENNRDYQ